jgi:hypothetical protein
MVMAVIFGIIAASVSGSGFIGLVVGLGWLGLVLVMDAGQRGVR